MNLYIGFNIRIRFFIVSFIYGWTNIVTVWLIVFWWKHPTDCGLPLSQKLMEKYECQYVHAIIAG